MLDRGPLLAIRPLLEERLMKLCVCREREGRERSERRAAAEREERRLPASAALTREDGKRADAVLLVVLQHELEDHRE